MLEYFTRLTTDGSVTFWLVAATFVVPGLALNVLERARGHEIELKGPVWAAALAPLAIALAGSFWRRAFAHADETDRIARAAGDVVCFGLGASVVLVLLAGPAVAAARRRRKPVGAQTT